MMDAHSRGLRIRLQSRTNETLYAYVDKSHLSPYDDLGALYYVVAVVLMYALSIVMMIASHIRKNQQDSQLRTYLKEMAILRKNDRRDKLIGKIVKPGPKKSVTVSLPGEDSSPKSHLTEDGSSERLLPSDTESSFNYDSIPTTPKMTITPSVKIHIIDENARS